MTTYQPTPTFYRITWNSSEPTNYSGTSGIMPFNSTQMMNTVSVTSSSASPVFENGDTMNCNGYPIGPFSNTSVIGNVVTAFNEMSAYTGVMATSNFGDYLTLQSINPTNQPIILSNYQGTPTTGIGLPYASNYGYGSPVYGGNSNFGSVASGSNTVINGTTVNFTGNTQSGIASDINQHSASTGVVATPYGGNMQLNSTDGGPILFGNGSSGTNTALGFGDGNAYGGGMTVSQALSIEQANMRWNGIISSVETTMTPIYWGSVNMNGAGTTDGSALPSTVSWTIGINHPDELVTTTVLGEPEGPGVTLYGTSALLRLLARGLLGTYTENRKVYNNTITVRGSAASRGNPITIQSVTAGPLDILGNINMIESNFSVSMVG